MNDMERRSFEDGFKKAFEGAEVQPADAVWNNIEVDLIKAEGEKMKKRVLFYQYLAAASITFALLVTGVGLYIMNDRVNDQLALQTVGSKAEIATSGENTTTIGKGSENDIKDAEQDSSARLAVPNATDIDQVVISQIEQGGASTAERIARHHSSILNNDRKFSYLETDEKLIVPGTLHGTADFDRRIWDRPIIPNDQQNNFGTYTKSTDRNGVAGGTMPERLAVVEKTSLLTGQDSRTLPALYNTEVKTPEFRHPANEVHGDPVALMFAKLKDLEEQLKEQGAGKKRKKSEGSKEKLWTSLAFAAGSFNGVTPSAGTPSATLANSSIQRFSMANTAVLNDQAKASGISYSLGVSLGTMLTKRIVLQGGLNYLTETSDFTSTQAIHDDAGNFKAVSLNTLRSEGGPEMDQNTKYIPTSPYTVNNNSEYLSVPIQAGYLIIKRKFVWQLNAGVSTDLFLKNTIDPDGNIETTTQRAGAESPYRSVNFSGLLGSEVSYKFGDHYRVGLNPGIRYPFNSVYKDFHSTPLTFDVGLRFRYIFN